MLGYNDHAEVRFCRDRPLYAAAAAFAENRIIYRGVAQLVARVVWDHQVAGSNPVTRTKLKR